MPRLDRATALALLPGGVAAAVLVWWTADGGGYDPAQWIPGAVLLGWLLVAVLAAVGPLRRPLHPGLRTALIALAAYTAWSYLSVLWADAPGPALVGSHRTLAFLAALALFAVIPWTPAALATVLGAIALGAAVVAAVTLARVDAAADPIRFFLDARLAEPMGYQNANAAGWTAAGLVALVLAARREVPWPVRPVLVGASALLLQTAVLSQSRGWLFTLPVVLLAVLASSPGRVRLLLHALPVAAAVALGAPELLEPFRAAGGLPPAEAARAIVPAIEPAIAAIVRGTALAAAAAAVLVLADLRIRPSERVAARSGRALAILGAALAVGGAVVGLRAADGDPLGRLDTAWEQFKDVDAGSADDGSRFATLGSSRYDFWRVGVDLVADRPLTGVGQDNYAQPYIARRRVPEEEPRWVHSLPLRVVVHTGAVGGALLALALGGLLWAALAARRHDRGLAAAAIAAALAPGAVWLLHGSVDWFWEFPLLSVLALGGAGAAGALAPRAPGDAREPRRRGPGPRAVVAATGVVVAAGTVALGVVHVAERDVDAALAGWRGDPAAAQDRLERAASLRPLDARPHLVEGVIAAQRGDLAAARRAFLDAADREPQDWFARFELGLIAGESGDRAAALRRLAEARVRNPRSPVVADAVRRARRGRPMTVREANAELARRSALRFGRVSS